MLIGPTERVFRRDPSPEGHVDPVPSYEAAMVAQLLDSRHLTTGGTHHVTYGRHDGPARAVLVPRATRDQIDRWTHLHPPPPPHRSRPMTTTTIAATPPVDLDGLDTRISHRLRAADYRQWRAQVQATGGCAAPIHLHGNSRVLDRDGAVLLERSGTVLAPCGNRRATVCPACSDRYAADAFHLLRAGLAGDDTKNVPATVVEHPRVFLTLTAPSFGPVHTRALTPRGHVIPCRCGERHHPNDPGIGTALHPDAYDYQGAVLWQAHAGMLWARFTIALRRALAAALGVKGTEFREHARLSYAKVAEYQRRGLVHFHAVIRLDGPDGPADPPPAGLDLAALRAAITAAARAATLTTHRPDGTPLVLGWGAQLDLREVTTPRGSRSRTSTGRSPTPPWPDTSPSTPPRAPAHTRVPTGRSGTSRTSNTCVSATTTGA